MGRAVTAETDFRSANVRVEALLDALTDGAFVTDGRGYREFANQSLNRLVGGDARRPLESTKPPVFLPPDLHGRYRRYLNNSVHDRIRNDTIALDWEILDARGRRRSVILRLLSLGNGTNRGTLWLLAPGGSDEHFESSTEIRRRLLEQSVRRMIDDVQQLGALVVRDATTLLHNDADVDRLSERERDVLFCLLEGHRVAAVADTLCVSPHTVRNHLKSIFRKLDVHSQAELIEKIRGQDGQ